MGSSRRAWVAVTLFYIALTLGYAWRLLPVIGSALPNDTGDPGLNTWIIWWNAHAIPLTNTWWNGPIFFPAPGAMALSETFLNLVPIATPMQWLGASAVLTYNVMYLLSFLTAALAAHALAHRLTGRHDAALVAGLAFGFAPYRAAQMPHLQTLWACWMPLGLLALHRFIATHRRRDLVLFGICWMLNGLATGYFLFFFSVLVGLWILWFARSWREWLAIGVTLMLATLPLVPLLAGYMHFQSELGLSRSMEEIEFFSADLSAFWATTPYVWPFHWTFKPGPEGELYPGATILILTIAAAIVVWRRTTPDRRYRAQPYLLASAGVLAIATFIAVRTGGWSFRLAGLTISLTRPAKAVFVFLCVLTVAVFWNPRIVDAWRRRSAFLFFSLAAVVMALCALGPTGHLFKTPFFYQAPYYWLMQLPGGHALRVPARFAMLFILCLSQAAALAFARLTPRAAPVSIVAVVCAAIAFEGWVPHMEIAKVPSHLDLAGVDRGAVVLELPMIDDYSDTAAMLRATENGHVLVNGFSGYIPPHYALLQEGLRTFDSSVIDALQRFGAFLVFVHQRGDDQQRYRDFIEDLPDAHRMLTTPSGALYQLPGRPAPPAPGDGPLHIASIRTSLTRGNDSPPGSDKPVSAMTDGLLTTRWQTPFHQSPGDEVIVTFDRPVTPSSVELDLGEFRDDYPRKLRISVLDDRQQSTQVWEGSTIGLAMLATLADRRRMPVVVHLPRPVQGRQLALTVVEGHPELSWSIAELRVFGR
jgi:hypothetical protein